MKLFRLVWFGAAAACDPVYSLHLHARVTANGAPAGGVWVMGLNSDALRPPAAVKTGADGTADLELSAFLRNPAHEPVALARPGEITVALPARDFSARKKGIFSGKEWEATLETALAPRPAELSLSCTGRDCTVDSPGRACSLYQLTIADSHAEGHLIESAAASGRLSFAVRGGPRVSVVAICAEDGKLRALVSNAAP